MIDSVWDALVSSVIKSKKIKREQKCSLDAEYTPDSLKVSKEIFKSIMCLDCNVFVYRAGQHIGLN